MNANDPAERAVAPVERLFAILHECRALVRELEPGQPRQESPSAEAERLLYFGPGRRDGRGPRGDGRARADGAAPGARARSGRWGRSGSRSRSPRISTANPTFRLTSVLPRLSSRHPAPERIALVKVTLLVMLAVGLVACQSMSDVKPGDGRKATIAGKSYDQVWDAAYKVADEHFEIRE